MNLIPEISVRVFIRAVWKPFDRTSYMHILNVWTLIGPSSGRNYRNAKFVTNNIRTAPCDCFKSIYNRKHYYELEEQKF
jgi:hypothetical protein